MFIVNFIVDGTPETAFASQFALKLSAFYDNHLVAHAFIDSDKIFRLEGFTGLPGLCGSGVFMEAYERITSDLVALLESLFEPLRAKAEGSDIVFDSHIWIRNPCGCCSPCICALSKGAPGALFILAGHSTNIDLAKLIFEKTKSPALIIQDHADKPALLLLSNNAGDVSELSQALECAPADITQIKHSASQQTFMDALRAAAA